MKEITDFTLREFLEKHIKIEDFGYLVGAAHWDQHLISEAADSIRKDFKKYLETDTGLFADLDEKQAQKGIDAIKSMKKKMDTKAESVEKIIDEGRNRRDQVMLDMATTGISMVRVAPEDFLKTEDDLCLCKRNNFVRTFDETNGGRYPPSEHAPGCNEYKTEKYIRLYTDDDGGIIDTPENQLTFLLNSEDEVYAPLGEENRWQQQEVHLTKDQFENLKEYQGP